MINKIREWLHAHKIYDSDTFVVAAPAMHQEDTNSVKARVRRAFEAQREQINARARVAHSCDNPLDCTKIPCFVFTPDIIRKTSTMKIPKKRRTNLSMLKTD